MIFMFELKDRSRIIRKATRVLGANAAEIFRIRAQGRYPKNSAHLRRPCRFRHSVPAKPLAQLSFVITLSSVMNNLEAIFCHFFGLWI
jgi:hypothetical protein